MKDDAEVLACESADLICCYPRERKTVGRQVWRGARSGHVKFDMHVNIHVEKPNEQLDMQIWASGTIPKWRCINRLYLSAGRKVMTNLDSILKSRDIILPTKVCLVKAMVFPVFMYGCESWTVKKAES